MNLSPDHAEALSSVVTLSSVITLTDQAVEHVKTMLASEPDNANKFLRLYVEGGGCSGMQYGLVFDELRPDDITGEFGGLKVLVDPFSANYLAGATVDYVDALTGGGFKITNPNARESCGCGKSFNA
jgi:iron-sulfur cluster assembly accessory protein